MNNEIRKTLMFGGVAVVLAALAFVLSGPGATPDEFLDKGEAFYPDFTDPNEATTLEVIEFDEESGSAVPFKVTFTDGRWTIPSHHDYPADGKDRLAKTAAGVIGITKDDYRTNNPAEHDGCGVLDPLDETAAAISGRGKRITLKGAGGQTLADLIVGNEIPGSDGMRFVRLPDQKRVYACRVDLDLSTSFADWIEQDLLMVEQDQIQNVLIRDYSIDEQTGRINQRDNIAVTAIGDYTLDKMPKGKVIDSSKVKGLLAAIDTVNIVGVREKPAGLSVALKAGDGSGQMGTPELLSLQNKGFFMARDGSLRSNEGEVQFTTSQGVKYTLRFGEVVYGSGLAVTAGAGGEAAEEEAGAGENRYLFVTTEFVEDYFTKPAEPSNRNFVGKADSLLTEDDKKNKELASAFDAWARDVAAGRNKSAELNQRFADWYYVISDASFQKLRLTRDDLCKDKPAES